MLLEIIQKQHLELTERFLRHQEALLQGEFNQALELLKQYDHCQRAHMQLEEKYLFPEFEKIERKSRWDVSLYEKEHEKIKKLYAEIEENLAWLKDQDLSASQSRRNIIALLDKEKTFKGLSEHHEDREEAALLDELDAQLDQSNIRELSFDIKCTWAEVVGTLK